jgi:large subunit ribosomal protein L15
MDLSNLANTPGARHAKKRVGRGCGSGMGKTSTRGHKGQNARKGHKQKLGFEGGQMPLVRRLPKRGFNNARFQTKALGVNVLTLEKLFNAGDEITIETLAAKGLSDNKRPLVKILATGELTKSLTVKVPCSAAAKAKIEADGGTVVA